MPAAAQRPPSPDAVRDTLFGDAPMDRWPAASKSEHEPWATFIRAREALAAGKAKDALDAWASITKMPDLESRHYAQAWQFLRENGVGPGAALAKKNLGVILEVPLEGGLDLLAAYPERNARYYNHSGSGVVWEHPDDSLDPLIDALLAAGQRVLDAIGPWDKERPAPPPVGQVRLNVLAPSGLHFGQAPFEVFAKDPLAGPVIHAGIALMQALIEKDGK